MATMRLLLLCVASFAAGLVDAIVGGGGLILVPAMLAGFPEVRTARVFGTNKSAAVWGTALATTRYVRRVALDWRALLPAAGVALAASFCGAWTLTRVSSSVVRPVMPFVLVILLVYTLARKHLGVDHAPRHTGRRLTGVACAIAAVVGFYDGFLGPGTGSFFVFAFVRFAGFDFLHASAIGKLLNVATNVAALVLFARTGNIMWAYALPLAAANVAGSVVGTGVALRNGAPLVRRVFVVVVAALIVKTAVDAW